MRLTKDEEELRTRQLGKQNTLCRITFFDADGEANRDRWMAWEMMRLIRVKVRKNNYRLTEGGNQEGCG